MESSVKYNIENNINFYEELYKSICDDAKENHNNTTNHYELQNICLITNEKLKDKYIELSCGHTFNYVPLFNDLVNYKQKFNKMEFTNNQLKITQIRCPYCRKKQDNLLPYYPELNLPKISGINDLTFNSNYNNYNFYNKTENIILNKCCYLINNLAFDETKEESDTNSKLIKCNIIGINKHKIIDPYIDEKIGSDHYCYNHFKKLVSKYKLEKKEQLKQEKNAIKLKEKEEKLKEKMEKKNAEKQNICKCTQILVSGINKGKECGISVYDGELCKRHYNIKNKNNK